MAGRAEVSIWASELKAGTLPRICVKSGKPADASLSFEFAGDVSGASQISAAALTLLSVPASPGGRGISGLLPLTRSWRRTFLLFRGAALACAIVAVVILFATGAVEPSWRPVWVGSAFGLGVLCVVILSVYGGLKPKGYVFKTAGGEGWVRLLDVHPNFASAVEGKGP